jgi:hypothetical protein
MTEHADGMIRLPDGHRELIEGLIEPVVGENVGGKFVVAASEVRDEGVPKTGPTRNGAPRGMRSACRDLR